MTVPNIFIGSSSEGLKFARAIATGLENSEPRVTAIIWNEGLFGLSQGTLQALIDDLEKFQFAVFVLTPDDLIVSHGVDQVAARDNVLFELGLFMGRLGPGRTYVVRDPRADLKMLSDFHGITVAMWSSVAPTRLEDYPSIVRGAVMKIQEAIDRELARQNENETLKSLNGRLIYLLRHMKSVPDFRPAYAYDYVLSTFDGLEINLETVSGWRSAAYYACRLLVSLRLAVANMSDEYKISDFGAKLLDLQETKLNFASSIEKPLALPSHTGVPPPPHSWEDDAWDAMYTALRDTSIQWLSVGRLAVRAGLSDEYSALSVLKKHLGEVQLGKGKSGNSIAKLRR